MRASAVRLLILGLLLAGLSSALAGCAARRAPAGEPAAVWNLYQAGQARLSNKPTNFSLGATFYVAHKDRTLRTVLRFWGGRDSALRLDVQAGVGVPLAYMAEDRSGLTVLYPQEGRAYRIDDRSAGLRAFGLDIPFTLGDLARMLTGPLDSMVPAGYRSASAAGDRVVYAFGPDAAVRAMTLDALGRPVELTGGGQESERWTLALAYKDEAGLPEMLTIELPDGRSGWLRVREASYRADAWPDEALRLELPPGTELVRLRPGERAPML